MESSSFLQRILNKAFGRNGKIAEPSASYSAEGTPLLPAERVRRLSANLEYEIKNPVYFEQSLLHRSYLQTLNDKSVYSNERMEFLGDSIVNLITAHYLFERFRDIQEGMLTKYRSRLVNRKALAMCAWKLKLNDFILLNPSALQSLEQGNDSLLADCFEAILAAMYLDSGGSLEPARILVQRVLLTEEMFDKFLMIDENFKSTVLEFAQARRLPVPRYFVVNEEGPDHDKVFTVEVFIGSESKGQGKGRSKKEAEQQAAMHAIEELERQEQVKEM